MPKEFDEKTAVESKKSQLTAMTSKFCEKHLDIEYECLCEKMIKKMARKRAVPFLSGRIEIWAASIVSAVGSINFLFDKSFEPYVSAEDIADYFKVSKSTVSQKAKVIRDMLKLSYWDEEFSTERMLARNPYSQFVMVNGFIVPISMLSE